MIIAIYADGGVIGRNPSEAGGTWAWCHVDEQGWHVASQSGVITPRKAEMSKITNNLTELLALVLGLQALPQGWSGTVCSDSQVSLGRLFCGWKITNIPNWLIVAARAALARLDRPNITHTLLDGHPTIDELDRGIGKRGHPVSCHNVWCDEECRRLAKRQMEQRYAA